jgi:hypothetical protein
MYWGTAMAARSPMIALTTMISIRVNPERPLPPTRIFDSSASNETS